VFGVAAGRRNAVKQHDRKELDGVDFVVANRTRKAFAASSKAENAFQLGIQKLPQVCGCFGHGRRSVLAAAEESIERL